MVSFQKIQIGVSNFIESEITAQLSGWKKIAVETAVGLYVAQIPEAIARLAQNPIFAGMNIVNGDKVDVKKLYDEISKHFTEPVSVDIPMLGTAQFTKENLDTLYKMITTA